MFFIDLEQHDFGISYLILFFHFSLWPCPLFVQGCTKLFHNHDHYKNISEIKKHLYLVLYDHMEQP